MGMREKLIKILHIPFAIPEQVDIYESIADFFLKNDVVPVVRCKDCKNRTLDSFGGHCCKLHKGLAMVTDESFCSYGERKDNGQ